MKGKEIRTNIKGQSSELYGSLFNTSFRPAPMAATHCVIIEVMHYDFSVKQITVSFNPLDTWTSKEIKKELEKPAAVGDFIGSYLYFLRMESKSALYCFKVKEIETDAVLYTSEYYTFMEKPL
jgi:hypothetical protein